MERVRVAVIGFGYFGPNLARNVRACPGLKLVAIADADETRLALAGRLYPDVRLHGDSAAAFDDADAVVVCTPVSTHHRVGMAALEAGKHVWMAKPLASSVADAAEMCEFARAHSLTLLVDHTFVYTGAVRKIRELLASGHLGDVWYIDSVRVNLGLFQHDADVVWDLAPHDLSILAFVSGRQPSHVQAVGAAPVRGGPAELAYLTLWYEDGPVAHVHVNWLSPVKVRRMLIGGSRRMLVYDDLEPSEKVRVYDTGVEIRSPADAHAALVDYRTGDCWTPKLDFAEALAVEAAHFAACIRRETEPVTGGASGVEVVRVLEACSRSLTDGSRVAV